MFGLQSSSFSQIQTAFSDLASLVSWEIAYTPAMSDASITVTAARPGQRFNWQQR